MKKLSLVMAALLFSSPTWATVRIIVEPSGKTATIKYATTKGEKVRAFALDITVDKGVIVDINDFIQGESTKEKPGYGIFPANFARYITVNPDTGEVAKWDLKSYTPVADPCDPGALPKSGLGTYGITVEMGALYYPPDDSSANAPLSEGTLFRLTLSEQAKVTVKLNTVRGGIVLTNAEAATDIDLTGATDIPVAAAGSIGIASTSAEYAEWLAVGKPACWTFPRQCHGDADGQKEGNAKDGYSFVGMNDMKILQAAWMVSEAEVVKGNGICADFAHDRGGDAKTGFYRVGPTDLNILVYYWMQPDAAIPADCGANLK